MNASTKANTKQRGVTLIELLIGITIGLLIVGFTLMIYINNRKVSVSQRDVGAITHAGHLALTSIARLALQAGHRPVAATGSGQGGDFKFCGEATAVTAASGTPQLAGGPMEGLDNATAGNTNFGNSDILTLRYYGSSVQGGAFAADGAITDCFGNAIAGPTSETDRVWSSLFVDIDAQTGNPALFCRSRSSAPVGASGTPQLVPTTQALVDNVESFQVLYGVGGFASNTGSNDWQTSNAGRNSLSTRKYLSAGQMQIPDWNNVRSIRVGLVISGDATNGNPAPDTKTYDVFGSGYTGLGNGAAYVVDPSGSRRYRLRQVFSSTIELKNAPIALGCPLS